MYPERHHSRPFYHLLIFNVAGTWTHSTWCLKPTQGSCSPCDDCDDQGHIGATQSLPGHERYIQTFTFVPVQRLDSHYFISIIIFISCFRILPINLYQDVSTAETASLQTASVIRLQCEQSEEHEECQPDLQGSVVTNRKLRVKNENQI